MVFRSKTQEGESLQDEISNIKRERILQEAAELFFQRGYRTTTVDDVAERFGATKPFIYYHFSNKIELLIEICKRGTEDALEVAANAASQPLSARDRLILLVRDFTAVALEYHKNVAIYFREQLNLPEEEAEIIMNMRREIDINLRKILMDGQDEGAFKIDNLAICSVIISGMLSYTFAWYNDSIHVTKEEIGDQMVKQVLRSVGVDPET